MCLITSLCRPACHMAACLGRKATAVGGGRVRAAALAGTGRTGKRFNDALLIGLANGYNQYVAICRILRERGPSDRARRDGCVSRAAAQPGQQGAAVYGEAVQMKRVVRAGRVASR
jgi:hypothetical protein